MSFTIDEQGRKHYVLRAQTGFYAVQINDSAGDADRVQTSTFVLPDIYHEFIGTDVENDKNPPRILEIAASLIFSPKIRDAAMGDLHERFYKDCASLGRIRAIVLMAKEIILTLLEKS